MFIVFYFSYQHDPNKTIWIAEGRGDYEHPSQLSVHRPDAFLVTFADPENYNSQELILELTDRLKKKNIAVTITEEWCSKFNNARRSFNFTPSDDPMMLHHVANELNELKDKKIKYHSIMPMVLGGGSEDPRYELCRALLGEQTDIVIQNIYEISTPNLLGEKITKIDRTTDVDFLAQYKENLKQKFKQRKERDKKDRENADKAHFNQQMKKCAMDTDTYLFYRNEVETCFNAAVASLKESINKNQAHALAKLKKGIVELKLLTLKNISINYKCRNQQWTYEEEIYAFDMRGALKLAEIVLTLAKKVESGHLSKKGIEQFQRDTRKYNKSRAVEKVLAVIICALIGLIAGAALGFMMSANLPSALIGASTGLICGASISTIACTMWFKSPLNKIIDASLESQHKSTRKNNL